MENKRILYCILGSVILSLMNNNNLIYITSGGFIWEIVEIASSIGIILTIIFSIILISNNLKYQK